jgi:hypothetical protein
MANRKSIASILLFLGSALCFFMPFVTVSCAGEKVLTLSGQQLATGTSIEMAQAFGPPRAEKIDPDPFAAIAALCAVVGILLSLVGTRLAVAGAVTGTAGAASLAFMASRMGGQIQKATEGMGSASEDTGFTVALVLLVAAAAWNAYLLTQQKKLEVAPASAPGSPSHSVDVAATSLQPQPVMAVPRCKKCGESLGAGVAFCEQCGTKVG